jgi:hypothetical protein
MEVLPLRAEARVPRGAPAAAARPVKTCKCLKNYTKARETQIRWVREPRDRSPYKVGGQRTRAASGDRGPAHDPSTYILGRN